MGDNYDFKYTDREYDIMIMKKDIKQKGTATEDPEDRQEMNELIESDPELYAGDVDTKAGLKQDVYQHILSSKKTTDEDFFDSDEISL